MSIVFRAEFVDCADAIDGDLLEVTFETIPPDRDEDARQTPYVLISRLFEFPGTATIEWHDGRDYDGGAEIVSVRLSRRRISIRLDQGLDLDVAFSLSDEKYIELSSFLERIVGDRIVASEGIPEPADRANDEERDHAAVSVGRRRRDPRHGSS